MSAIGIVFPGQGSQSVGMLADVAAVHPKILDVFSRASTVLGYDLWQLVQNGPESQLNETEYTQPAMLVADVALFHAMQAIEPSKPTIMAGHSLGEYAALVCSEAMTLETAVTLVRLRGQLMQRYVPLGMGAMAAVVGLSDEQVTALCEQVSQPRSRVMPANFNAIGQVVVAGHTDAIERLIEAAEGAEARLAKRIPVSVPCHCDLLKEAAFVFGSALEVADIQLPTCSVISNVDAKPYISVDAIRSLLQQQLYLPVKWVETIQYMQKSGVELCIECGPGQVLSGLIKRIDRTIKLRSVHEFYR